MENYGPDEVHHRASDIPSTKLDMLVSDFASQEEAAEVSLFSRTLDRIDNFLYSKFPNLVFYTVKLPG